MYTIIPTVRQNLVSTGFVIVEGFDVLHKATESSMIPKIYENKLLTWEQAEAYQVFLTTTFPTFDSPEAFLMLENWQELRKSAVQYLVSLGFEERE